MRLLNYKYVLPFINKKQIEAMEKEAILAKEKLLSKSGKGNDFTGWVEYPNTVSETELEEIVSCAEEIRKTSQVLLVIGIGGSYLGAKAGLSMLGRYFKKNALEVLFAGNTLSSAYTSELLEYLKDKDFAVNVISKSGTTTEPAIAFRLFKKLLEEKYGAESAKRIYCTTTVGKGALYSLAIKNGYRIFSIPEDIGGRYSVLTPVGLLPMAAYGIDIKAILQGAKKAYLNYTRESYMENDALLYASLRNLLYRKGKYIEILASYEPSLGYFGEWYKQLFGESEGKDHFGIYPSSVSYTTDLHSLGQYVQDGQRHLFETVIQIKEPVYDILIEKEPLDFDGLNFLSGKTVDEVNKQAFLGTAVAHTEGGVPNLVIEIPQCNAYWFGYLTYFFMFSCGISGYILDVNPFNQEGVEAYKKNMFALLGKEGYQELKKILEAKLHE